jgi:predicted nucleic acid-binding Zn ribbon protein
MDHLSDMATDFAAKRDREERRFYGRRPKKIADIVAQLIHQRGYGRLDTNEQLADAWRAAAGQKVAAASRVSKLQRGKLEVWVGNSTMMQELGFQKQAILAELQRQLPEAKIRDLRFKVGQIN